MRYDRITVAIMINRGLARNRLMDLYSMRDIRSRVTPTINPTLMHTKRRAALSSTCPSIMYGLITSISNAKGTQLEVTLHYIQSSHVRIHQGVLSTYE